MIGHTLCAQYGLGKLVNPHASMEVPVADLKRAPGGKGSKGGDPINLYWAELIQLREAPVSIKARHFTPFSSTGICAPVSPLSLIFNIFPSSPLALNVYPTRLLIVIGVLLLMSGPPPPLLLYCLPAPSR